MMEDYAPLFEILSIPLLVLYVIMFRHYQFGEFTATFTYIIVMSLSMIAVEGCVAEHPGRGTILGGFFAVMNVMLFGTTRYIFSRMLAHRALMKREAERRLVPMIMNSEMKKRYMERYLNGGEGL